MAANERTLGEEQLATISGNMLQKTLIDVSRTVGKRIFRSWSPVHGSRSPSCAWRTRVWCAST